MSGQTSPSSTPMLHPANILGSPGSTWTGVAAILAVITSAMATGLPMTQSGWITFGLAVVAGVGGIFSKA